MRLPSQRDLGNPQGLFEYLSQMAREQNRLEELLARSGGKSEPAKLPTMDDIRRALEADGTHPLSIEGLYGQGLSPQPASVKVVTALPDARDYIAGTIVVVDGSPDTLHYRTDTNPPTWAQIATTPTNMMTTDTAQNVTGTKTFQSSAGITVDATGGQFDSAAQYTATVVRAAVQAIPTGAVTLVSWDSEIQDQGGLFDAGTPTRLSAKDSGIYLFGGQAVFAGSAAGTQRTAAIKVSGGQTFGADVEPPSALGTSLMLAPVPVLLTAADYIEMEVFHDVGANLNLGGVSLRTFMFLHKLC